MGKAEDEYTPEQRAIIKKLIEDRAAYQKTAESFRKNYDRIEAIRNGLVQPRWAKSLMTADQSIAERSGTAKKKRREGPQERLLTPVFNNRWPPNGQVPASLLPKDIVKQVGDDFLKYYGRECTADRKTILRKAGRLSR